MFCGNCGTNNEGNSPFCVNCGAPLQGAPAAPVNPYAQQPAAPANPYAQQPAAPVNPYAPQPAAPYAPVDPANPYAPQPAAPYAPVDPANPYAAAPNPYAPVPPVAPKKSKKKAIIIAAIAVVVVAALVVGAILLFGGGKNGKGKNSPEDVAEAFIDAFTEPDAEALLALAPKSVAEEEAGDVEEIQEYLDNLWAQMDSIGATCEFSVGKTKSVSDSELEDIQEEYEEYDCDVEDAKEITLTLEVEVYGYTQSEDMTITVIKIDGKWYLDFSNFSF